MSGVRILEVAQFTFTPAAGAVLADWGADVIKVEHAVTGDAQRGLQIGTGGASQGSFHPLMEHPNRGKRSIGLALEMPSARDVLLELPRTSDVFLTNFLPDGQGQAAASTSRTSGRRIPTSSTCVGSAHGPKGPDAGQGGLRRQHILVPSGKRNGRHPSDSPRLINQPAGAYGDSHGRNDHRRRYRGGPFRPRPHRRAVGRRRLAPERRGMGHGICRSATPLWPAKRRRVPR